MEAQEEASGGAVSGGGTGGGGKSGFLCRQSSSRWIPTTDQIRILRDLYYNCGVRSPSAEQIQRISARLRQFGKIEGKNVFYWFQNHKARERQKKRLTVDVTSAHNKYTNSGAVISPDLLNGRVPGLPAACPSPGLYFEHSLPGGVNGGSTAEGCWMGVDQSYYYQPQPQPQPQRVSSCYYEQTPSIETLPLFPVRSEEENILIRGHFPPPRPEEEDRRPYRLYGGDGASLELSLYSYGP